MPAAAPASAGAVTTRKASCAAKVTIAGKRTCLAVGRSCRPKYKTKYASKGFTCKKTKGKYRLERTRQVF